MALDGVAIRDGDVTIDEWCDERVDPCATELNHHLFPVAAGAFPLTDISFHSSVTPTGDGCTLTFIDALAFSASYSIRRPREMRDITVPAGMSSMLAISA